MHVSLAWQEGEPAPGGPVYYVQSQNNNLHEDFADLVKEDLPETVWWASEALGREPDAVNFWLGESRAVTSMHKDHYENLYVVIAGTKTFTLIPPTESFTLYEKPYPTATYTPSTPSPSPKTPWTITPTTPQTKVPWPSIDPLNPPSPTTHPFITHQHPITVTLAPGETLYLPSMWYHRVAQTGERLEGRRGVYAAVAVNYWFDMEFDARFAYYGFVKRVGGVLAGVEGEEEGDEEEEEFSEDEGSDV
ncbi:JmjC domain-containing protein 7 [Rhizophlyctis rosea]|nr:JmjC domain-containing protein 7 [Rhizophlyctis rosea]